MGEAGRCSICTVRSVWIVCVCERERHTARGGAGSVWRGHQEGVYINVCVYVCVCVCVVCVCERERDTERDGAGSVWRVHQEEVYINVCVYVCVCVCVTEGER